MWMPKILSIIRCFYLHGYKDNIGLEGDIFLRIDFQQ